MFIRAITAILLALATLQGFAQEVVPNERLPLPEPPFQRIRLEAGYGEANFPITCKLRLSQLYFNQGVALLHGFDLRSADRSFHHVAQLEPDCGMAYWGRAMANLDNPDWLRPFVRRAVDRKQNVTPREREWIDALAGCLPQPPNNVSDQRQLAKAFEQLALSDPADVEALAFYLRQVTLNHIDGDEVQPSELAPLFDKVLAANARHPISACRALLDEDTDPAQALRWAETAVQAAPRNPQLRTVAARLQSRLESDSAAVDSAQQAVKLFAGSRNRCAPLPTAITDDSIDAPLCRDLSRMKVTESMLHLERIAWQPRDAAAITLPDQHGELRALEEFRGAPVLLVFFLGAGCPHCFEQMLSLAPRKTAFAEAGIQVVTISTDSIEGLQQTFEIDGAKEAMPFLVLSDKQLDVFREYGVFDEFSERPMHGMFLLDARGRMIWQNVGVEPFMAIQSLLNATKGLFVSREIVR